MLCDVRPIPENEIEPLMNKIYKSANARNCDITHDDEDDVWFMNVNWDKAGLFSSFNSDWKFTSSKRCETVWFSYYPPNSGNVRFNGILTPAAVILYNELLSKFGHSGKNTLAHFEKL